MTTILLLSEQVTSTVEFIVEQYEKAQASRWEDIRAVINPCARDFHHWRDCFLNDWEEVRAKIQGISLLFDDASDSYGMGEYFECSKDKVTDLWLCGGIELSKLQYLDFVISSDIDSIKESVDELSELEAA